ncbi:MAG TPA: 4Fe-4S dicluster domain-containing protein [Thermoflexus sp.]|nr:4Fe-4S dicluster domain-containing protein [Thermoflexus sp.]
MAGIERRVRYESELDPSFAREVIALSGSPALLSCIQCGTCSSACPLSLYMDYTPRRIIAMVREGFKHEVLRSLTIWLCASCYACTVECPKQIPITDVMYALKRYAIREGVYPPRFPIPVLARLFYETVRRRGRFTESSTVLNLYLRTMPLRILGLIPTGWGLLRRGRFPLRPEGIRDRQGLRRVLQIVEQREVAT